MIKYGLDTNKVYTNKKGFGFKVTEFINANKVNVVFDSGYTDWFNASNIRKGSITDKLQPTIHGVGINDADYIVNPMINGKRVICPIYSKWAAMMYRCYSDDARKKHSTYDDCYVCDEWHLFSNFKQWIDDKDHIGKQLDKDILFPNNKIYSPNTCCLVSQYINSILLDCGKTRGDLLIGVTKNWNKFEAKCSLTTESGRKTIYLGLHETEEKAHASYVDYKCKLIREVALTQDLPVKKGLLAHADILESTKLA